MAYAFTRLRFNYLMRTFAKQRIETGRAKYGNSSTELRELYRARKSMIADTKPVSDLMPESICANNELSLSDIRVMGFDYDYTLAAYTTSLHELLFNLATATLVSNLKYPPEIMDLQFDPSFAVRGVHFDTQKGLMMKIDSFHYIQLGTVYRGLQRVPDAEVKALYDGSHISLDYMNSSAGTGPVHQMIDLFAIPEISLISLIIEFFIQNNIEYDPEYVFYDIQNVVQGIHKSGTLHIHIMNDLELYLEKTSETHILLERLREEGKKLFLITNSGFPFVNAGMKHIIGSDWLGLFDIIIVNARKPKFFHLGSRPFRLYDPAKETHSWGRVTALEKGKVYQQGNVLQLQQMTGWFGPQVLYFGDHVYSDLADPSLRFGWRTGAIVPELEREIEMFNRADYKATIRWLVVLQHMIEDLQSSIYNCGQSKLAVQACLSSYLLTSLVENCSADFHPGNLPSSRLFDLCVQHQSTADSKKVIAEWLEERDRLRLFAKSINNPYFGSLFRTHHNPSYFFRRLGRFADIYMSSLTNLRYYPPDYTFYPHRMVLPHEPSPFYHTLVHP